MTIMANLPSFFPKVRVEEERKGGKYMMMMMMMISSGACPIKI